MSVAVIDSYCPKQHYSLKDTCLLSYKVYLKYLKIPMLNIILVSPLL